MIHRKYQKCFYLLFNCILFLYCSLLFFRLIPLCTRIPNAVWCPVRMLRRKGRKKEKGVGALFFKNDDRGSLFHRGQNSLRGRIYFVWVNHNITTGASKNYDQGVTILDNNNRGVVFLWAHFASLHWHSRSSHLNFCVSTNAIDNDIRKERSDVAKKRKKSKTTKMTEKWQPNSNKIHVTMIRQS